MKNKYKTVVVILIFLIIVTYSGIFYIHGQKKENKELNNINQVTSPNELTNTNEEEPLVEDEEVQNNNTIVDKGIVLGLYHLENGKRYLKPEYDAYWTYHKDIITLGVNYTNEEVISGDKIGNVYLEYFNKYKDDLANYKIGYNIQFSTDEKDYDVQILEPKDAEIIYDILEIYMYDNIKHINSSWYSHVEQSEYDEKTLLQSIKVTSGKNIDKINSAIKVTAFAYSSDDFDNNNLYKGKLSYTVTVKKAV